MTCHVPRLLLAAPASGSGKTTLTCALLRVLERRGLAPCAFKCGPDYIDPMFHRSVLALPSRNLDLFFSSPDEVRRNLALGAQDRGAAVIEGVMGYYDGVGAGQQLACGPGYPDPDHFGGGAERLRPYPGGGLAGTCPVPSAQPGGGGTS